MTANQNGELLKTLLGILATTAAAIVCAAIDYLTKEDHKS